MRIDDNYVSANRGDVVYLLWTIETMFSERVNHLRPEVVRQRHLVRPDEVRERLLKHLGQSMWMATGVNGGDRLNPALWRRWTQLPGAAGDVPRFVELAMIVNEAWRQGWLDDTLSPRLASLCREIRAASEPLTINWSSQRVAPSTKWHEASGLNLSESHDSSGRREGEGFDDQDSVASKEMLQEASYLCTPLAQPLVCNPLFVAKTLKDIGAAAQNQMYGNAVREAMPTLDPGDGEGRVTRVLVALVSSAVGAHPVMERIWPFEEPRFISFIGSGIRAPLAAAVFDLLRGPVTSGGRSRTSGRTQLPSHHRETVPAVEWIGAVIREMGGLDNPVIYPAEQAYLEHRTSMAPHLRGNAESQHEQDREVRQYFSTPRYLIERFQTEEGLQAEIKAMGLPPYRTERRVDVHPDAEVAPWRERDPDWQPPQAPSGEQLRALADQVAAAGSQAEILKKLRTRSSRRP